MKNYNPTTYTYTKNSYIFYIYIYFIRNFYHPSDPSLRSPFLQENCFTFIFSYFVLSNANYISKTQKNILFEWVEHKVLELEMRNRDGLYFFIGYINFRDVIYCATTLFIYYIYVTSYIIWYKRLELIFWQKTGG